MTATEQLQYEQLNRNKLDEARLTYPFIRLLCDYKIMFSKITIIQKPDGTVEFQEEYPPAIQKSIDELGRTIRQIQEEIYGRSVLRL